MAQVTDLSLLGIFGPVRSFSAKASIINPIGAVSAEVFIPGAQRGMTFVSGSQRGEVFIPGAQRGEVAK